MDKLLFHRIVAFLLIFSFVLCLFDYDDTAIRSTFVLLFYEIVFELICLLSTKFKSSRLIFEALVFMLLTNISICDSMLFYLLYNSFNLIIIYQRISDIYYLYDIGQIIKPIIWLFLINDKYYYSSTNSTYISFHIIILKFSITYILVLLSLLLYYAQSNSDRNKCSYFSLLIHNDFSFISFKLLISYYIIIIIKIFNSYNMILLLFTIPFSLNLINKLANKESNQLQYPFACLVLSQILTNLLIK